MSDDPSPSVPTLPVRWEDAQGLLLPVLRRTTEPAHAWAAAQRDPADALVRRRVLPFLHELVALDLPDVRLFLSVGQLAGWGVDAATAHRAAHANLAPLASDGLQQRAEYGLWQLASGDGVETSRVLLSGWLAAFADQVDGRPVAIVPASRVLLVGGDGRAPEVERLVSLADQVFRTAQQPVSPVPLTVDDDGRLVALELPADHPSASAIAASRRLLAAYEYAAQRDQLLELPTAGTVLQVQLVRQAETGQAWTQCSWSQSATDVWLPRTDRVELVGAEGSMVVPFEALQHHARGCLETTDLDPERFQARWPAEGTLTALRADALPELP